MIDPLAFFFTISTYGTWLPGDERGWIEYKHGWQKPDAIKKLEAYAIMSEDACILGPNDRRIVEQQLLDTCRHRGWLLHSMNCRSNHMHFVVSAPDVSPKKIRKDIKAWCTRKLKELSDRNRISWWADRGSIRWIFDEESLENVICYVNEAQDQK